MKKETMKLGLSATGIAFVYAGASVLLFALFNRLLGNHENLFSALVTNAWDDVSGGSMRSTT